MAAGATKGTAPAEALLVPYRPAHVRKYHQWMEDEWLRRVTHSERLSLEQEFAMQTTWTTDPNKRCRIVLDSQVFSASGGDEVAAMVGDVNAFLLPQGVVEVTVMIAERSARGKGFGASAVRQMMALVEAELGRQCFVAKIDSDNGPSLRLFRDKLGFREIAGLSAPPGEVHLFLGKPPPNSLPGSASEREEPEKEQQLEPPRLTHAELAAAAMLEAGQGASIDLILLKVSALAQSACDKEKAPLLRMLASARKEGLRAALLKRLLQLEARYTAIEKCARGLLTGSEAEPPRPE